MKYFKKRISRGKFNFPFIAVFFLVFLFYSFLYGAEWEKGLTWEKRMVLREARCTTDQDLLFYIAKTCPIKEIREIAVKRLKDKKQILEILKTDPHEDVREAAMDMGVITDPEIVKEIVENEYVDNVYSHFLRYYYADKNFWIDLAKNTKIRHYEARRIAIKHIEDQNILIDIVKKIPHYGNSFDIVAAVEKITDQNVLADIARNDPNGNVREAAVEKLDPSKWQKLLEDIAQNDKTWTVRRIAAVKIIDKSIISKIVQNDPEEEVRKPAKLGLMSKKELLDFIFASNSRYYFTEYAVKYMINDQSMLIDVAQNSPHHEARAEAVKKINDMAIIYDIAKNDEDGYVRWCAVKRITDQEILIDIAKNDETGNVCLEAYKRISDQEKLREIALSSRHYEVVRERAFELFTDLPFYKRMAIENLHEWNRRDAVEKLDKDQCQELLAEIAKNDEHDGVRGAAVEKLYKDQWQELLTEIAKNDENYASIRKAALEKLNDQDVLTEIAKKNIRFLGYWNILRTTATLKITNQSTLGEIVMSCTDNVERLLMINKLRDQDILAEIIIKLSNEHPDDDLIYDAFKQLNDNNALLKIFNNTPEGWYRYRAVMKITDQNMLKKLAQNATDWKVRAYAIGAMNDLNLQTELLKQDPDKRVQEKIKTMSIIIKGIINDEKGNPLKRRTILIIPYQDGKFTYKFKEGKSKMVCFNTKTDYYGKFEITISGDGEYREFTIGILTAPNTFSKIEISGATVIFKFDEFTKMIDIGKLMIEDEELERIKM